VPTETTAIILEVRPVKKMRRAAGPTVGDYYLDPDGTIRIVVADFGDPRYNALVHIHEATELLIVEQQGITWEAIDKYDSERPDSEEPGDEPDCPYHAAHAAADIAERAAAVAMGVAWADYANAFDAVDAKVRKRFGLKD